MIIEKQYENEEFDKVIFLDIDGVLNSLKWSVFVSNNIDTTKQENVIKNKLDPSIVKPFMDLVYKYNIKIVFISAWIKLNDWKHQLEINGVNLNKYYHVDTEGYRYDAIDYFIQDYNIKNYVIIDDCHYDKYLKIFPKHRIIKTLWNEGMISDDLEKIKNILKLKGMI